MARYSYRQVSNAVCEVLREKGNGHIQEENSYYSLRDSDQPMCFVGHVFAKLDGRLLEQIRDHRVGYKELYELRDQKVLDDGLFAPTVWGALDAAQGQADSRSTWGLVAQYFQQTYREGAHKR